MTHRQKHPTVQDTRRGLSLIEVIVSTLLVGLVLVTSLKTVGAVMHTWQVTETQHDGMALAVDLMTEVLQTRYVDPEDPTAGFQTDSNENSYPRTDYDDTDDYDNWTASPPQSKDGTALTDYTGWTRTINVQKVNAGDPNNARSDGSSDKGLRKITITVTALDGTQTVLVALRAAGGVMEQAPPTDSTFVSHVGGELQVGTGTDAVRAGTNITNHAQDQ